MIVPDRELRRDVFKLPKSHTAIAGLRPARVLFLAAAALLCVAAGWCLYVYARIEEYAHHEGARPADAIAVFGAAEYDGRPSPVLRARLNHALTLYRAGLAPLVITLGGGGDPHYSEGGVGRGFLLAQGVPEGQIIAETQSGNTAESARRLAAIARANGLHTVLAVSDGTHLFRIHALCASEGLVVYTSPRPPAGHSLDAWERLERITHEMVSYTLWRLHMH